MPVQLVEVGVIDGTVVFPLPGHKRAIAGIVQAHEMLERVSAAVGDQEHVVGQSQVLLRQQEGLVDGRMAVLVAVEAVCQHRQGAVVVNDGELADLHHLAVVRVAVTAKSRRQQSITGNVGVASPSEARAAGGNSCQSGRGVEVR